MTNLEDKLSKAESDLEEEKKMAEARRQEEEKKEAGRRAEEERLEEERRQEGQEGERRSQGRLSDLYDQTQRLKQQLVTCQRQVGQRNWNFIFGIWLSLDLNKTSSGKARGRCYTFY